MLNRENKEASFYTDYTKQLYLTEPYRKFGNLATDYTKQLYLAEPYQRAYLVHPIGNLAT